MLEQFQSLISSASQKWGVPELWIKAFIMTESSGDPNAFRAEPKINDASYGLMQLLYRTAQGLGYSGDASGLFDPAVNIDLGTHLIADWRRSLGDDFKAVYSAYNSGSPNTYLSSPQVASNVNRAISFLENFIKEEPLVAGSGAVGVLLVLVLVWWWTKRGRK